MHSSKGIKRGPVIRTVALGSFIYFNIRTVLLRECHVFFELTVIVDA